MKYALLIHLGEGIHDQMPQDERERRTGIHRQLQDDVRKAGQYGGAVRLAPVQSAVSVRTRGKDQVITDGPFAETKEHLVGLYLVDCKTLDEALAYARRIPVGPLGTIEVRPVAWLDESAGKPLPGGDG